MTNGERCEDDLSVHNVADLNGRGDVVGDSRWAELRTGIVALLWPTQCVACGAPDRDCCSDCLAELRVPTAALHWVLPRGAERSLPVFAAGRYEGALRALIVGIKHEGRVGFARHLGPPMRRALAPAWEERTLDSSPVIVAAPSRSARVRERGYRHLDLILRRALGRGAPPHLPMFRALRALRGRVGQVGLDIAERQRNAALVEVRAHCRGALEGREVVIVDDIVTTGATLVAASRALESAGARVIAAATLCLVQRRDGKQ